ncbi:hypothetical protein AX17_000188 [Amanita inopinata Kibby_2008]|nr:hypothetical protein AX17_000188 [Amanita inopinata Kibby_2008]
MLLGLLEFDPVTQFFTFMCRPSSTRNDFTMPQASGNKKQPPLLVTLSARALSSFGFGISVIAISFGWLFPGSPDTNPNTKPLVPQEQKQRHGANQQQTHTLQDRESPRRRSEPPNFGATRRYSREGRSRDQHSRHHSPRHVSFVNASKAMQQELPVQHIDNKQSNHSREITEVSATPPHPRYKRSSRSSSSSSTTIVATPPTPHKVLEPCEEDVSILSDTLSMNANDSPPPRASKSRDMAEKPAKRKHSKKTSHGFFITWSHCRCRKSESSVSNLTTPSPQQDTMHRSASLKEATSKASPKPAPNRSQSLSTPSTCYFRKSQRRRSAPAPRTDPYEAPYFAAPPVLFEEPYESSREVYMNGTKSQRSQAGLAAGGGERRRSVAREPSIRSAATHRRSGMNT